MFQQMLFSQAYGYVSAIAHHVHDLNSLLLLQANSSRQHREAPENKDNYCVLLLELYEKLEALPPPSAALRGLWRHEPLWDEFAA